jgi:hypothetical protein
MMNSEVRIVPGSAVCDRHRTNPKNPTERCSVAAFIRKPQIDLFTPTLHHSITPGHSSLIKPNQAISCLNSLHSQPPRAQKSPPPQSSSVKPRQTQSKCSPIVVVVPRFRPPSLYIVVHPAKRSTNCAFPLAAAANTTAIRNSRQTDPSYPSYPSYFGNPQSEIAASSTSFHLIPLNST